MYVCMYVCMYACMHVCMFACICMHACVYVRMYVYIYDFAGDGPDSCDGPRRTPCRRRSPLTNSSFLGYVPPKRRCLTSGAARKTLWRGVFACRIRICTYIHIHTNTYIQTHTYIHTYIHTYTHTYIHTYIHT